MKTISSRFGKVIIPSLQLTIENCWLRLESDLPYLEVPYDSFQNEYWDIITGSFNGLDEVTFYKCNLGGGKGGRGGSYRRINFSFMFENKTFKEKSDILFTKVSLDSKALDKWLVNKFWLSYSETNQKENSLSIPKRKIVHKIKTKFGTISITQGFDGLRGSYDATFQRKTLIDVSFKEALHIDEINKHLVSLRRLILFLTHESPQIIDYTFLLSDGQSVRLKERSRFNEISGFSEGVELKYLDIKSHLETIIKSWVEKEKLVQVIELIQEKYMNTSLSSQNYFLNCCVAVESFHLRFVKSNISDEIKSNIKFRKSEREEIASKIRNEELKKSFKNKTTDWKKTTFKEKVRHFSEGITIVKGKYILISTDDFIGKIVNTRNKIAHEGEYLKYLTRFELFLFGKVMELLIKIEILKELGVTDPKTVDIFYQDARNKVDILAEINEYN